MSLNTEKHRTILFSIIQDIFNSNIGKYLGFKGGTACYFLYGLDRFSTDLDFDLLDEKQHIDQEVVNIISQYGNIKKGKKIELSYGEDDINIKIDITRKIWKNNQYEIVNFYGMPIRIQTKKTIFANKLVALYERNTNRDIYDIYFFLKNSREINDGIITERTGKTTNEILLEIRNKLIKLPDNYKILDGLGEVLTQEQKNFTKNFLVKRLIGLIDIKLQFN